MSLYTSFLSLFYPFVIPESLHALFRQELEHQRRRFREATRPWSVRHWQVLSKKLSNSSEVRDVSGLLTHLKCEVVVDGSSFPFYTADGTSGVGTPVSGSLAMPAAKLWNAIQSTNVEVSKAIERERTATNAARYVQNEQTLAAGRAAAASANLDALKGKWAANYQEVGEPLEKAEQAVANMDRLSLGIAQRRTAIQQILDEGTSIAEGFEKMQQERRTLGETMATPGRATPPEEEGALKDLDRACTNELASLRRIEKQGRDWEAEVADHQKQFDAAASVFQDNVVRCRRSIAATGAIVQSASDFAAELQSDSAAESEWKRIKTEMKRASLAYDSLSAQLAALRLWHLTKMKDHAQKQELHGKASELIANVEGWKTSWQQRLSKLSMPKKP